MNTFQIVMLIGAAALALSVFWPQMKAVFYSFKPSKTKPFVPNESSKDSSLVEIIRCWEHLKVSCEKADLKDACGELNRIFPLFVPKANNKEVRNV